MQITEHALQVINGYKSNKVIMDFVEKEAMEKTASDIREKTGGGTTSKAVQLLIYSKNQTVINRFNEYVASGLIGCYLASVAR